MDWLRDRLVAVLQWQLANPGAVAGHDDPFVPPAGHRVWGIFLALNSARGSSGFGPLPIGLQDMEAYQRLARTPIRPFEIDIIQALDRAYLEAAAAKHGDKRQEVSTRPLSPALFDAVFG
ncbi:MAG: hypothetical protein AB7O60_15260 [Variibacter sp.]